MPILGICLGMQLLAQSGDEDGPSAGLGWIPGTVKRFAFADSTLKVPHVGFNAVEFVGTGNPLFARLGSGADIAKAVRESDAEKVYVCNLMTKHGETDNYKASDFVNELHRYLGGRVDRVIVNSGSFLPDVLKTYDHERSVPVEPDRARLARLVPRVVIEPLNLEGDTLARHDPERLVQAIFSNGDIS